MQDGSGWRGGLPPPAVGGTEGLCGWSRTMGYCPCAWWWLLEGVTGCILPPPNQAHMCIHQQTSRRPSRQGEGDLGSGPGYQVGKNCAGMLSTSLNSQKGLVSSFTLVLSCCCFAQLLLLLHLLISPPPHWEQLRTLPPLPGTSMPWDHGSPSLLHRQLSWKAFLVQEQVTRCWILCCLSPRDCPQRSTCP